jgi:hypothetical protein
MVENFKRGLLLCWYLQLSARQPKPIGLTDDEDNNKFKIEFGLPDIS